MRTYYDVLGVAPDTPDVVIKAAFRALAKEYHPDRANAASGDTDRFIEIQNAYAVLSKPESRNEYDAELREAFLMHVPSEPASVNSGGALSPVQWPSAPQDMADIERICARLSLYSESLAQAFHEAYLRGECGDDPWRFAGEMERSFFREYFGEDPDVQAFARLLLLGSRTGAAQTLNQLMAGAVSAPDKDIRSVLAPVLDQHFAGDALFTEWLKVKFGVLPVTVRPPVAPASPEAGSVAAAPAPKPKATSARGNVLRSVAVVFIWAVALYFVLFAALPMIE
jgi:curved DNA-binding protein CbpA